MGERHLPSSNPVKHIILRSRLSPRQRLRRQKRVRANGGEDNRRAKRSRQYRPRKRRNAQKNRERRDTGQQVSGRGRRRQGRTSGGRSRVHRESAAGPWGPRVGQLRARGARSAPPGLEPAKPPARATAHLRPILSRQPGPTGLHSPRPPGPSGNVRTSGGRDVLPRSQWAP